jgi:hypothetical protein
MRLVQAGCRRNLVGGGLFLTLFAVFMVQITARFGFNRRCPGPTRRR